MGGTPLTGMPCSSGHCRWLSLPTIFSMRKRSHFDGIGGTLAMAKLGLVNYPSGFNSGPAMAWAIWPSMRRFHSETTQEGGNRPPGFG